MKNEEISQRTRIERDFLPFVRQPARYIGGEVNQIRKSPDDTELSVALCFPDVYEVGMSNTALAVLYEIINSVEWAAAERIFTPWPDAVEILRENKIELFSLESRRAMKDFDIVGFTISTELCFTNVLTMLDLGKVTLRSIERGEDEPLIVGGGSGANCCEPAADFFDLFVLGDGEDATVQLIELVRKLKEEKLPREQLLLRIAKELPFVYVPRFYEPQYENEKFIGVRATEKGLPEIIENAIVKDFETAPAVMKPIVPFVQAVHERVSVEIMRGCPGRCLFCQASFCKRPLRSRSVEIIFEIAKNAYEATGFETVSLLSLSTADYPYLEELVDKLQEYFAPKHVGISVPSLRVAEQLKLLPKMVKGVRKGGLTIAVEAAAESLRTVINKPLKDEDLLAAVEAAYKAGWRSVKLYFMVGLPGETVEDIRQIVNLSSTISHLRRKLGSGPGTINATVSWLVPKPHTPFQWNGQESMEYFFRAKEIILEEKRKLRLKTVQFKFHKIEQSVLESAFARGDRQLSKVIETAWRNGACFDLWNEHFDFEKWLQAFEANEIDLHETAQQSYAVDDALPWDHLGGPDKQMLQKLFEKTRIK